MKTNEAEIKLVQELSDGDTVVWEGCQQETLMFLYSIVAPLSEAKKEADEILIDEIGRASCRERG